MEEPLISIIIPVYNVEAYVERCLNSVINQTYKNLEIILVNDGSTDGSRAVCDTYAKQDARIQVIHLEKNQGVSHARNVGSSRAKGAYIGFLDADDYIETSMYQRLYESLVKNQAEVSVCEGQRIGFGKYTQLREDPARYAVSGKDAIPCMLRKWSCGWAVSNKLLVSSLVKKYPFEEKIYCGEDLLFFYRIFRHAKRVSHIPEKLYYYVYRENSAMHEIFNIRQYTESQVYGFLHQDVLKHYPDLAVEFEHKILLINERLAVKVIESRKVKGRQLHCYLHKFRKNIRQYMSREAISYFESKKIATEVVLLYASAELFCGVVIVYKKLRGCLR